MNKSTRAGRLLRDSVVYGPAVIPVAVKNMLIDRVAFLGIKLPRESLRKAIEGLFHCDPHCGSRSLLLAPVEHELVTLENGQKLLSYMLDLRLFGIGQGRSRPYQKVEDCE